MHGREHAGADGLVFVWGDVSRAQGSDTAARLDHVRGSTAFSSHATVGVSPPELDFGHVPLCQVAASSIVIHNLGDEPLVVHAVSASTRSLALPQLVGGGGRADVVVVDGMQGGTAATQEVFIEHVGIPTLAAIPQAVQALQELGVHRPAAGGAADRKGVQLIVSGGIRTGADDTVVLADAKVAKDRLACATTADLGMLLVAIATAFCPSKPPACAAKTLPAPWLPARLCIARIVRITAPPAVVRR